jgi:hypothetical protein
VRPDQLARVRVFIRACYIARITSLIMFSFELQLDGRSRRADVSAVRVRVNYNNRAGGNQTYFDICEVRIFGGEPI